MHRIARAWAGAPIAPRPCAARRGSEAGSAVEYRVSASGSTVEYRVTTGGSTVQYQDSASGSSTASRSKVPCSTTWHARIASSDTKMRKDSNS
eukprot:3337175-Rhodomonas_salina.1